MMINLNPRILNTKSKYSFKKVKNRKQKGERNLTEVYSHILYLKS